MAKYLNGSAYLTQNSNINRSIAERECLQRSWDTTITNCSSSRYDMDAFNEGYEIACDKDACVFVWVSFGLT